LSEIDGKGFFACMKYPENLLFDELFDSLRILKVASFEPLPDALDQLSRRPDSEISFKKDHLEFIEEVWAEGLLSKKEPVDLFDKPLMGFGKALL
jgi:hypothetical protein